MLGKDTCFIKEITVKNKDLIRIAALIVCACVVIVCAVMVVNYAIDYIHSRQLNDSLAAQYHASSTEVPTQTQPSAPAMTADALPDSSAAPEQPPTVTDVPKTTYDPWGGYPDNPYREILPQFKTLQATNRDICGWITIGSDLDQAVVQRDNTYYLTRDYMGQSNVNGAIFIDMQVDLRTRPSCYILYGHNMKTQAMFGMLRKYDNASYLREHPIITFNTQYEDGEYAIFSLTTISLNNGDRNYVQFFNLPNAIGEARSTIIERLKDMSDYRISLDVDEDDQLLILVTCTGDDAERRLVAARRLRSGEDAKSLNMTYLLAEKR